MNKKVCSKCRKLKDLSYFHKRKSGYKSACKVCRHLEVVSNKTKINNRCPDCDKLIDPKSKRCNSCSQNRSFNHEFNRHRSKQENLKRGSKKEKNGNWINGQYLTSFGYRYIRVDNHPHSTKSGYVMEHRLVMEKHLGRYLKPEEVVHHIDNNKLNNKVNNLKLFSDHKIHRSLHAQAYDFIVKKGFAKEYIKHHVKTK